MSNGGHSFRMHLSGGDIRSLSYIAVAAEVKEIPDSYRPFLDSLVPQTNRYSKDREPTHIMM